MERHDDIDGEKHFRIHHGGPRNQSGTFHFLPNVHTGKYRLKRFTLMH